MLAERVIPWNELGVDISHTNNVEDALTAARLNWRVEQKPVIYNGVDTGYFMNIRDADDKVLGIVGGRYAPVQNDEAFKFVDELVSEGLTFEIAGGTPNGRRIYMVAKLPEKYILGDKTEPYICLSNSHDGFGSLKVFMTPIRIACNNMINMAINNAQRYWPVRHTGIIENKLHEAHKTLFQTNKYMDGLETLAEELSGIKISENKYEVLVNQLIPITEDMGVRKENSQLELRDDLLQAWNMDDLGNIRGTGWGFLNAVADATTHKQLRPSSSPENAFLYTVDDPVTLSHALKLIREVA